MKFCFCCKILKMCCPPCPRNIIEKSAFQPQAPSYEVHFCPETSQYIFNIEKRWEIECLNRAIPLRDIEFTYTDTKCGTKIACMYYGTQTPSKTTILYSHGNGSDLGRVIGLCVWIARKVNCNILAYDYSGYGRSTGKPSEKRLYADIEAAFNLLLEKYNKSPEDIVLMGQSLGSAPTLDLASRIHVKGAIVQSGFASALNVAFPHEDFNTKCCDVFENIDKIPKVSCPVLIIHGTADDVIDLSNSVALYKRCPTAVEPLWVDGAGHNDVELYIEYRERLYRFLNTELS